MSEAGQENTPERQYPTRELVRRLLALAWRFRADCLISLVLGAALLFLALTGLQFLGVVVDVLRHAVDPSQRVPSYPFGWVPSSDWSPLAIVSVLSVGIVCRRCSGPGLPMNTTW
jgi:ATP-binding cassette subfamily B protein